MARVGGRLAAAGLAAALGVGLLSAAPARAVPAPAASPSARLTPSVSATASVKTTPAPKPSPTAKPTPSATPTPTATPTSAPVAPVGPALAVEVLDEPVLTLPAGDGVRDSVRVRIRSGTGGAVEVLTKRGERRAAVTSVTLKRSASGFQRTVRVPLGELTRGRWAVIVRRSASPGVSARTLVRVGSGRPVAAALVPTARTVYPWRDGALDVAELTVSARDETGALLPVTGRVRLEAGKQHRTRTLKSGVVRVPITGLRLGAATATATFTTAGGEAVRSTDLTLAPTQVGTMRLARSADTVQPVSDGLLDTVALSTSAGASASSTAPVSGLLTVAGPDGVVVQSWPVPDGTPRTVEWNGRVNGRIVPGTYTATLTMRGPEGVARVATKPLTVSSGHLPYRVRDLFTVAEGNQQGLAVHDGIFYVGYDNEDGTSRIERYDENGNRFPLTLSPLSIGHAAELAYSTSTRLLYAVNGGAKNPTTVWALEPLAADGPSALRATYDLSRLGNCGMIAIDDANARLLVFAGSAASGYTITPMSLTDVTTTNPDGSTAVVPAGTLGTSTPIAIEGVPQGLEIVGDRLWVYTSFKNRNRVARYDIGTATLDVGTDVDLMNPGEGEGLASRVLADGTTHVFVGTHTVNRVSVLEPVADE